MNGHAPAIDSPACPCWWVIKGRQQGVLPPLTIIRERGIFLDRERIQRAYTPTISSLSTASANCLRDVHNSRRQSTYDGFHQQGLFIIQSTAHIHTFISLRSAMNHNTRILTTKADARYHGFGMQSIRLLCERYGGTLSIHTDDNIFNVNILLPAGNALKA